MSWIHFRAPSSSQTELMLELVHAQPVLHYRLEVRVLVVVSSCFSPFALSGQHSRGTAASIHGSQAGHTGKPLECRFCEDMLVRGFCITLKN